MLSLVNLVSGRPWAIRSEIAGHVRDLLHKEGIAGLRHLAELKAAIHADRIEARRERGAQVAGTVAVIPIIGTLTQRAEVIDSEQTRSTAEISDEVTGAAADPKVDAVVLEIDSPGGEVYGVPEAWEAIRQARKLKPIVAAANSVAASAGYYLFSAADEGWITPSGEVGSVGVFALHIDASKAIEDMGEKWDFIVATDSPHKIDGAPTGPLSEDARGWLQKTVDRYMAMFVRDVAKGRGVSTKAVLSRFGGGRMLGAEDAVAAKMADGVGTLDVAIRRAGQLAQERRANGGARARADDGPPLAVEPEGLGPGPGDVVGDPAAITDEQLVALDRLRSL